MAAPAQLLRDAKDMLAKKRGEDKFDFVYYAWKQTIVGCLGDKRFLISNAVSGGGRGGKTPRTQSDHSTLIAEG
jgi:hypothetical protein